MTELDILPVFVQGFDIQPLGMPVAVAVAVGAKT
jgi:hypothetical protein